MSPSKKHVVIIGAGISGISAAHELAKHSSAIQVTILEARNRIGGRLDTHRNLVPGEHGDIPIDFGASWIHGVDPSNPIVSLAEVANARLEATNRDAIYYHPGQDAFDEQESNHYWAVLWDIFEKAQKYSKDNRKHISSKMSFKKWLDHFLATRQSVDPNQENFMSSKDLQIIPLLAQFWADENAIPLDKVSLKYMDAEDMPPGDHCMMTNGYDRVLDVLCKNMDSVDIRLEHVVEKIEYNESNVKISTSKGIVTADVVLVTLPLGVLKSNSVTFSPPLPESKQTAIKQLGFGTMVKAVLYFPTCFWPSDRHFINFLPIPTSIPNPNLCRHLNKRQMKALVTYMNDLANYTSLMPIHGAPILIAYMANDSAEVFEKLTDEEAMEVLVCQLSHYFDILVTDPKNSRPTRVFMTRWNADPFARGSYTSIPTGAHQSDLAEFEIPVGARSVEVAPTNNEQDEKKSLIFRSTFAVGATRNDKLENYTNPFNIKTLNSTSLSDTINYLNQRIIHTFTNISDSTHRSIWKNSNRVHNNQVGAIGVIGRGGFLQVGSIGTHIALKNQRSFISTLHRDPLLVVYGYALSRHYGSKLIKMREEPIMPLSELDPLFVSGCNNNTKPIQKSLKRKSATHIKTIAVNDADNGRIYFAGEHTTPTSFASVHGALMTGRREAAKILAQTFFVGTKEF